MTNRFDAVRLQPILIRVALIAAALAALTLLVFGRATSQQSQLGEHVATLSALSQNLPLQAGAAVRGSAPAFDALAGSRAQLERALNEIDAGKSSLGFLASPGSQTLADSSAWVAMTTLS
jgi:hypothetical protein